MKFLLLVLLFCASLFSEVYYTFSNVNLNYLDWTNTTQKETSQEDFFYIGLEGGLGWDGGNFYGNINIENPTKKYDVDSANNQRYTAFGDLNIDLVDDFKVHFQNFHLHGNYFYVNDFVVGAGYEFTHGKFWLKPFLGVHFTNSTYFDGFNGYMTGWSFNYDFELFNQKFSLFQWNEIEFAREKSFYESDGSPVGDSKSYGLNGNLNAWWHLSEHFSSGVQYRYAQHKLGFDAYQDAFIYTVKYNF